MICDAVRILEGWNCAGCPAQKRVLKDRPSVPPTSDAAGACLQSQEPKSLPDSTYADESEPGCGRGFSSHSQVFRSPRKHEGVRATVHCLDGLEHLKPPELDYGAKYLQPLSSPAKMTHRGFKSGRPLGSPTRSPRRRSGPHAGKLHVRQEYGRPSPKPDQQFARPMHSLEGSPSRGLAQKSGGVSSVTTSLSLQVSTHKAPRATCSSAAKLEDLLGPGQLLQRPGQQRFALKTDSLHRC